MKKQEQKTVSVEIPIKGDVDFTVLVDRSSQSITFTYPTATEISPQQLLTTMELLSRINVHRVKHVVSKVITEYIARQPPLDYEEWQEYVKLQSWANGLAF